MNIEINEQEWWLLVCALCARSVDEPYRSLTMRFFDLRTSCPRVHDSPSVSPSAPSPETVRWAKDKVFEDAERITVTPSRIQRKDLADGTPRLEVMWQGQGRGNAFASVWDEALFAWVSARIKQETVFYVARKGKYMNIVGVKA